MTKSGDVVVTQAIRKADELENSGDLAAASEVLSTALVAAPGSGRLRALLGRLEYLQQNYSSAIRNFDLALSHRPHAASTLYFRARARSMIDDLAGALLDFAECVRLEPHSADAHYEMGLIHEYRRDFAEALASFERARALEKSPERVADLEERIVSLRQR